MAAFEASVSLVFPPCVSTYIKPMDGIEKSWQSIQLILAAHFRKEKDDFPSYFWTLVCVLGTELKTVCVYVFLTVCIVLSLLKHNSKRAINSLRGLGQINTLN